MGKAPPATWQAERLSRIEEAFASARVERPMLLERLGAAIRMSIATGAPSAAILLDLNRFAEFNAAWGPTAGDEALAVLRSRVAAVAAGAAAEELRSANIVAGLLDSDHFLVVAPSAPNAESLRRAAARFVTALAEPFMLSGRNASDQRARRDRADPGACRQRDSGAGARVPDAERRRAFALRRHRHGGAGGSARDAPAGDGERPRRGAQLRPALHRAAAEGSGRDRGDIRRRGAGAMGPSRPRAAAAACVHRGGGEGRA